MKFITEDDLRELYRKEPFTKYEIAPGTRITPGARQFLADRQIFLPGDEPAQTGRTREDESDEAAKRGKGAPCRIRLMRRIQSTEALFLEAAEGLLGEDVLLAQKVVDLKKCFSEIRSALESGKALERLVCDGCTGIHEDNFSGDLGDCFEVTEFHIQLDKGREIISLHKLRCALRELQLDLEDAFAGPGADEKRGEAAARVNQIINILSQQICYAAGGEKCQRKM